MFKTPITARARKLRNLALVLLTGSAIYGLADRAGACADIGWSPVWRLAAPSYDGIGRAAISPGNDTRINLLLLLRSLKPVGDKGAAYPKSDWDTFELGRTFTTWTGLRETYWPHPDKPEPPYSSECTPPADAVSTFSSAIAADKSVPDSERTALLALRAQVGCGAIEGNPPVSSPSGREYLAYLQAASAFYAGNWDGARSGFAALAHARTPWIVETAAYMPIRIAMRQAVAGAVDQYGNFAGVEKTDHAATAAARTAIAAYLKAWPNGRYAASAQALTRRVLWLEGNVSALAAAYQGLLDSTPADSERTADLAEEIDLKLLGPDARSVAVDKLGGSPLLLAVADLRQMRVIEDTDAMPFPAERLASQQASFAGQADLYTFLQASRAFYAGETPRSLLPLVPDATHAHGFTPLAFSRQILRGMALARAKDPNEAGFWRTLIPNVSPIHQRPLAELGLALSWQGAKRLDLVFAPGSPIEDRTTREILLQTMARPAILRAVAADGTRPAHERDVARFTLLYKDLSRQAYADFIRDKALVPADAATDPLQSFWGESPVPTGLFTRGKASDGFACPALDATVATLAHEPANRRAMLCLGEFWRLNGFDGFSLFTPGKVADTLGHAPDEFPGKPLARDAIYAAVLADRNASREERAYALYRSIMCYAPSGYNGCAGPFLTADEMDKAAAPKPQRKAWYNELKTTFPDSPWAKKLRYYW